MIIDDRLLNNLEYNFGPIIMEAFADPNIVEILVNSDGNIWTERLGEKMKQVGTIDAGSTRLIISLVASALETTVTVQEPIVEGELPNVRPFSGARFEGVFPPVVSMPCFTIRKKASKVFDLEQYVTDGIMPSQLLEVFYETIKEKKNIVVVGGTGSGKTTFVNALIGCIAKFCPDDRLLILEDTMELQSTSANTQFLRTSDYVDMERLLKTVMRMRPDRILIGEVRDKAALALIKSWNTGHPGGIATVHANSAAEGLPRIAELIAEATEADKSLLIAEGVNLIVYIGRVPGVGRRIQEVVSVVKYDKREKEFVTKTIYKLEESK